MMKIKFERRPFSIDGGLDFAILDPRPDGRMLAVNAMSVEEIKPGAFIQTLGSLDHQSAQELIDNLWDCGLRPSEGTGSAGAMAATEKHLEDMRKINKGLMKKIGVEI